MWRQAIQSPGRWSRRIPHQTALTTLASRSLSSHIPHDYSTAAVLLHDSSSRSLSTSAQLELSTVDEVVVSPLSQIPQATAERAVRRKLLDTLQNAAALASLEMTASVGASSDRWQEPWENARVDVATATSFHVELEQEETLEPHCVPDSHPVPQHRPKTLVEETIEDAANDELEAFTQTKVDTTVETSKTAKLSRKMPSLQRQKPAHIISMQGRLLRAVRNRKADEAIRLFQQSVYERLPIQVSILSELFHFMLDKNPVQAYKVLRRYEHLSASPVPPKMYVSMCRALGNASLKQAVLVAEAFKGIKQTLVKLDVETYQHVVYPELLVSMVRQPVVFVGVEAHHLHRFMKKNNYPIHPRVIEDLLKHSKYSRPNDVPLGDLFQDLAESGHEPEPVVAIHALENLFPFTDMVATGKALKAILKWQSAETRRKGTYRVDMGTLEQISTTAARQGNYQVNLMVWDLMDMLGYHPTEALYENTIQAFSMTHRQDHNVFSVLNEMELNGFVPSRALIQSITRSLRFSVGRVDNAYYLLTTQSTDRTRVTVSSLNVIISACAEIGDVDRAFATLDDFASFGLVPNSDTYAFALEALARSLDAERQPDEEQRMKDAPSRVEAANAVLSILDETGTQLCHHGIHQYVQLLLDVGEVDAATDFLLERLDGGEKVSNKTILLAALAHGKRRNFETGRQLASRTTEPLAFLHNRLARWEKEAK